MGDSVAQTERLPNVPIKYDNFVLRYYIRLSIVCFVWRPNELRAEIQLSFVFVIFFFGFSFRFHWLHLFALFPTYSMFTFVIYLVSIFRWIHFISFPFYIIQQLFNLHSLHYSFVYYFLIICIVPYVFYCFIYALRLI